MITETMSQRLEEARVSFFRRITRKQETRQRDGSWRQVPTEAVLRGEGTQTLRTYVARQQATVAEGVATWPVFDMCAQETGYGGGGGVPGSMVEA